MHAQKIGIVFFTKGVRLRGSSASLSFRLPVSDKDRKNEPGKNRRWVVKIITAAERSTKSYCARLRITAHRRNEAASIRSRQPLAQCRSSVLAVRNTKLQYDAGAFADRFNPCSFACCGVSPGLISLDGASPPRRRPAEFPPLLSRTRRRLFDLFFFDAVLGLGHRW